jgi:hypothetical protein
VITRPLPMVFFVAFAVLAVAGWWCVGASSHAHALRVHSITVDGN